MSITEAREKIKLMCKLNIMGIWTERELIDNTKDMVETSLITDKYIRKVRKQVKEEILKLRKKKNG